MKKTALLTITGLFPFVVFSQPLDLLNNFLNETKQASGAFEQQTFQKDGKPAEELQKGTFSFSRPENLFGLIPARILRRWFATAAESIFGMRI